jgi:hypothetical protein
MSLIDGRARILELLEMDDDLIQRDVLRVCHVSSPPGAAVVEATPGKVYTKTAQGASVIFYQDHP